MSEEHSISDAEWQVMNVLWDRSPLAAADVVAVLQEKVDWHARTIKTLLHRLVKKQVLDYEQQGTRYLYSPRVARADCVRQASESFLSRVFNGEAAPMLEYFVKDGGLTPDEIASLKRLLDEESLHAE